MEHLDTFDPHLSANLHNEILEIGWNSMQHELSFDQAAPTWWDRYGEECLASGLAARLAPEIIEFLKLARNIEPELQNLKTRYEYFFYYVVCLAPPSSMVDDDAQFGGRPDQFLRLYYVTDLKSHPFGVVFDQDTLRVRAMYSLTMDDDRTPWVPLQSLLGAFLDMIRIGKITTGEESDSDEENSDSDEEEDDSDSDEDVDMETEEQFSIEPRRPWILYSHSEQILDRTVEAFEALLKAIQDRMPNDAPSPDGPSATPDSINQAISRLLSTSQTGGSTFAIKFLKKIQGHLASARPFLRFIAPGIRIPHPDDLAKQPFEGIDFHSSPYNNPILIFPAEEDDGAGASIRLEGDRNPFPHPYNQNQSPYACGLWISESHLDGPEFDDQCRLVLPGSIAGEEGSVHYARSTDGFLLETGDGLGFSAGLYQTEINPFLAHNHGVELFRVLENWAELVESGVWQVDEHGVAGGIHKRREADQDEAMSMRYRVPLTW